MKENISNVSVESDHQGLPTKGELTPMDKVFSDYDSRFHDALFRADDEDSSAIDMKCAREILVSEGLGVVKKPEDCDRILSELYNDNCKELRELVEKKKTALEFAQIISDFDKDHSAILGDNSSDEDDEALQLINCNELRFHYLSAAIEKANTQQECLEVLGRTFDCPEQAYIRELVKEKMAALPISVRQP